MNYATAVAILTAAPKFLLHESADNYKGTSQFACIAIDMAARGLLRYDEEAVRIVSDLQDEVEAKLGGASTLNSFLSNTFGRPVEGGSWDHEVTQPIRRAILESLLAKYTLLLAEEVAANAKAESVKLIIMDAVKKSHEDKTGDRFICLKVQIEQMKSKDVAVKQAGLAIKDDISKYISYCNSMEEYLLARDEDTTEEQVRNERTKMIDFLVKKYEEEAGV